MDRWVLLAIGIFFFLFGLFALTNVSVAHGPTIMGFAALVAGVLCIVHGVSAFSGRPVV